MEYLPGGDMMVSDLYLVMEYLPGGDMMVSDVR